MDEKKDLSLSLPLVNEDAHFEAPKKNTREQANCVSFILFWWVWPLIMVR
jgi:hypothetical protein